ncbi:DMT family transporter [bacterium]|nr:DMT family transporter [bacterium]
MKSAWVTFAVLSAIFTCLRQIHIKNKCSAYPSEIVILVTRLCGAVILLPFAVIEGITITRIPVFAGFTALTVLITAFATVIQIALLQREDISRSVPYLSFIPIFMIPWSLLMLGELPGSIAFLGIMLTCAGSYIINLTGTSGPLFAPLASIFRERTSRLMLVVSMCLAFNTVCDKIAITASSAFSYVYVWSVSSTVVMAIICLKNNPVRRIAEALTDRHVYIQGLFWVGGYSCQMFAIGAAFGVESGTTYVRALTLLNILGTVVFGGTMFREKNLLRKSLATILMVGGSIIIVLSSKMIR